MAAAGTAVAAVAAAGTAVAAAGGTDVAAAAAAGTAVAAAGTAVAAGKPGGTAPRNDGLQTLTQSWVAPGVSTCGEAAGTALKVSGWGCRAGPNRSAGSRCEEPWRRSRSSRIITIIGRGRAVIHV